MPPKTSEQVSDELLNLLFGPQPVMISSPTFEYPLTYNEIELSKESFWNKQQAAMNALQSQLNTSIYSQGQIWNKTGFVPDPLSGEGSLVPNGGDWIQLGQMKPLSLEPSSIPQPTNYYFLSPELLTFKGSPIVPDSFLKPKSGAQASPSGSSKLKGIRKDIFKNGIL